MAEARQPPGLSRATCGRFPARSCCSWECEIGQGSEWNHDAAVSWWLLDDPLHRGLQSLVGDINRAYTAEPALHATDNDPSAFAWMIADDADNSVYAFVRSRGDDRVLVVVQHDAGSADGLPGRRAGAGIWRELLNSDADIYGGSNAGNGGSVQTREEPAGGQGRPSS